MLRALNPDAVVAPLGAYSHAVEVPPNARQLVISGQVGVAPDGTIAQGIEAQAEQLFGNLRAILNDAGMDLEDIVKLTSFIVRREDLAGFAKARSAIMGDLRPASTLLLVPGLARPEWLVEVEALAARA